MCGMRIYHCYRTTEVPEGVHRPHQVVAAHSYVRPASLLECSYLAAD